VIGAKAAVWALSAGAKRALLMKDLRLSNLLFRAEGGGIPLAGLCSMIESTGSASLPAA